MPRERSLKQSLGHRYDAIKQARVLLVGAGGIGCELLKNLVKTGFGQIHLIDLDTIDLSNLNRQFLFRHEHIKKSKALVAKEVAQKYNSNVQITAYHANIKETRFNAEWFSSFDIVFNALDNLDARRHVNRMCLLADVPLIESGTTGYNGNVQVIKKGKTACYDCKAKEVPKSYPVCTIRSTPSQPIHCIVWAKSYLLPELFGTSEDEVADFDITTDSENVEEIQKLKEESEALKKIKDAMGCDDFAKQVFNKVYKEDIERLANMSEMWKDKKPPTPLDYDILAPSMDSTPIETAQIDQRVWSLPETFRVFTDSLSRLSKRLSGERTEALRTDTPEPTIAFDKDDNDTLDFVTAAANLRSAVFAIEPKSKFDTKQMAGNIIPAIATTNAMTAALCVFEAYKIMYNDLATKNDALRTDKYSRVPEVYLSKANMHANKRTDEPNPECAVCSTAMARVKIDLNRASLQNLLDVVRSELGYTASMNIMNNEGGVLYDYMDAEDEEEEATTNTDRKLSDLNVAEGSFLIVKDDDDDEPRVDLQLLVEALPDGADNDSAIRIVYRNGQKPKIPRGRKVSASSLPNGVNGTNSKETTSSIGKRKRGLEDDVDTISVDGPPSKKLQANGDAVIEETAILIQDDDGAIVLDD